MTVCPVGAEYESSRPPIRTYGSAASGKSMATASGARSEMRERYLARHPELTLSDEAFEDRGISAFTGANPEQGNLMAKLSLSLY
jgi:hypothetical protein